MVYTTNDGVAKAWIAGEEAQSSRMHTDGRTIWSYGLRIGHIAPDNVIRVRAAQAGLKGGKFYSMTTSTKHVPPVLYAAYGAQAAYGYPVVVVPDACFEAEVKAHGG